MTPFTIIFLLINAIALLALPRHLALLPLLVGCCYMTTGQSFDLGPVSLTVIRVLVAVGVVRVMVKGERMTGPINTMDKLMVAWMVWIVISSVLHPGNKIPLVFNLGQAYSMGGIYFLFRVFCGSRDELVGIVKMLALLLGPIAIEMTMEHLTGKNMFSLFGGYVSVRDSKFRAVGPFAHAILAGSVAAACFPLMVGIWKEHRVHAAIGAVSCLVMVAASNSSGPIMSIAFALLALFIWRYRAKIRIFQFGAVAAYLALEVLMNRPAYYIIAEIDLTGSSTGWHRAALIESSIKHLDEWWLAGTNYTRHWMPTGVSFSPDHTDLTNYYLLMGVWGGLPLVLIFIAMIWTGFRYVGLIVKRQPEQSDGGQFMVWCLGASLFAHTATCISVSYFDQSYIFMYLCLAAAGSLHAASLQEVEENPDARGQDEDPAPLPVPFPRWSSEIRGNASSPARIKSPC